MKKLADELAVSLRKATCLDLSPTTWPGYKDAWSIAHIGVSEEHPLVHIERSSGSEDSYRVNIIDDYPSSGGTKESLGQSVIAIAFLKSIEEAITEVFRKNGLEVSIN